MKLSNRVVPLSVAAIIGVFVGIAIAPALPFPSANAASQSGFVLTGTLSVPGQGYSLNRVEDKETGIVCYTYRDLLTCATKK